MLSACYQVSGGYIVIDGKLDHKNDRMIIIAETIGSGKELLE